MNPSENKTSLSYYRHTQFAFSFYKLLGSPLEALFYILGFILIKDLNATPFQLTLLVSSKPAVALLSYYGNLFIKDKASKLKTMIILTTLLGSLPCLFIPFVSSIWFVIGVHALFMLSLRAVLPAWSEVLKINLISDARGKVFSKGAIANYSTNIIVPLLISPLLDNFPFIWRWLFFAFACLNCLNAFLLMNLKLKTHSVESDGTKGYRLSSLSSLLIDPWKKGLRLIKERADFRNYQIVFMLCGGGLMVMQPILPIFFKEALRLSYFELTLATSLCKGVGFVFSSPLWAKKLNRISIHLFNFFVCSFAGIFALFLIGSQNWLLLIYLSYLMYGIMQAGSEMSWNLSGPIFAETKDSTLFTGVNIAAVGVRGCIVPFLGELLFFSTNSTTAVFLCGGSLCFLAGLYSYRTFVQTTQKSLAA